MHHRLSTIDPHAQLGKQVVVEPFTTIYGDVVIGDNTWIGPHVTIMDGARIGGNCRVFPGAVISAIPQDVKYRGEESIAIIGDNTTIRECATVNRGTVATEKTIVGNNCILMAYSHVAHDCIIGDNCILVNSVQLAGEVMVHDWAIIGGGSLVHQFVRIGAHAFIGGGVMVRKDVPPYVKAARDPVSFEGVNAVGLKRRNFSTEKIREIHDIYRFLYLSKMNNTQALESIEKEFPQSEERDIIISFVRNSSRGIIPGYV
jgi:UDP-N-acetylglucosamine acyltransferase